MTIQEKTIKLAEAAGWRLFSSFDNLWAPPKHIVEYNCDAYPLPDYFHDLNAVHELFKCIPQNLKPKYFTILCSQVSSLITLNGYYEATEATAEQRCEAIGKTLDLW